MIAAAFEPTGIASLNKNLLSPTVKNEYEIIKEYKKNYKINVKVL
jgi:hypothetical protein